MKKWVLALLEGVRFYWCIVRRGWWRRWPYLPLTTERFIKFRLDTAYGMPEHGWSRPHWTEIVQDTKRFLLWRRALRLEIKRRRALATLEPPKTRSRDV